MFTCLPLVWMENILFIDYEYEMFIFKLLIRIIIWEILKFGYGLLLNFRIIYLYTKENN